MLALARVTFTAAQAAQKKNIATLTRSSVFTAAQAAQKIVVLIFS